MNTLRLKSLPFGLALAMIAIVGCSDPAADKEKAEVTEAIDIPAEPAVAEAPAATEEMPAATEEPAAPAADATVYTLTGDSYIGFTGSKPGGQHSGDFREFDGTVTVTGDDITTAKIKVSFKTGSVDTDDTRLTGVLIGENFFESEEFPEATFESASVEKAENGYTVTGNLTIRGMAKGVTFTADINIDGDTLTSSSEFTVNRKAWQIGEGWVSDTVIRDDVIIELDISAETGA